MQNDSVRQSIIAKFEDLSRKRKQLLSRQASIAKAITEAEIRLNDIRAAARVFSVDLDSENGSNEKQNSIESADGIKNSVKDYIVEYLKKYHPLPQKAKSIQISYELEYATKLHYKTIGMSLYRLAVDGVVKREGRNWSIVLDKQQNDEVSELSRADDVVDLL
jgi:hypothetical protein